MCYPAMLLADKQTSRLTYKPTEMKHNLRHSAESINRWVDGTPTFEVTSITINYIRVISVTSHCRWICYSSCGSQPIQGCDGNWSKRRQSETSTTKTSSNQNVDKPKRRQTKLSTNQNVDRTKRRQTKTSTNQNLDKPKRRQTETSTNQNADKPKRRQTETLTPHFSTLLGCTAYISTHIA